LPEVFVDRVVSDCKKSRKQGLFSPVTPRSSHDLRPTTLSSGATSMLNSAFDSSSFEQILFEIIPYHGYMVFDRLLDAHNLIKKRYKMSLAVL